MEDNGKEGSEEGEERKREDKDGIGEEKKKREGKYEMCKRGEKEEGMKKGKR